MNHNVNCNLYFLLTCIIIIIFYVTGAINTVLSGVLLIITYVVVGQ
jgi:type III secretory pathway component EscT